MAASVVGVVVSEPVPVPEGKLQRGWNWKPPLDGVLDGTFATLTDCVVVGAGAGASEVGAWVVVGAAVVVGKTIMGVSVVEGGGGGGGQGGGESRRKGRTGRQHVDHPFSRLRRDGEL